MDETPLSKSAAGGDKDSPVRFPWRSFFKLFGLGFQLFLVLVFLAMFAGWTTALVVSAFQFTWELIR